MTKSDLTMIRVDCIAWLTVVLLSVFASPGARSEDMRSEQFRSTGALQEIEDKTRYLGKVSKTPCECVKMDYDDGTAADLEAGHELPGLCAKNARYVVCHHDVGRYAGQSEICPLSCVSLKEIKELTAFDEKRYYTAAFEQGRARYKAHVPPAILAAFERAHPEWLPLTARKVVDDYDRQMEFDSGSPFYFQGPMKRKGQPFVGALVVFDVYKGLKLVPMWAIFDVATATQLYSGPADFLFDPKGSFVRLSLFATGPGPEAAPSGSLLYGMRYGSKDAIPCCGPYVLDDVDRGPVLVSADDAAPYARAYSAQASSPGKAADLHQREAFYGAAYKPPKKGKLTAEASLKLMPLDASSTLVSLPSGEKLTVYSHGGDKNSWVGVLTSAGYKGYLPAKSVRTE